MSESPSLPTLIFRMRKPRATASWASRTISGVGFTEMVKSVSIWRFAPPSTWYSGLPQLWANRSNTAMSTAALALVFFTMQRSSAVMVPSRSSTSRPTSAGAMNSSMAHFSEPSVSPVITAVGGASP